MAERNGADNAKRDGLDHQKSGLSQGAAVRDVTLLCTQNNVLSHPTRTSRNVDGKAVRQSIETLPWGELKRRYPSEFNCWRAMKQRAETGTYSVHEELESFRGFLVVLGPAPAPKMTVDRIDNERKDYSPDNVRWATKQTQSNNRSNTIILTDSDGISRPLTEWATITGQNANTMRQRRKRGWSDAEVIAGKKTKQSSAQRGNGKAYWPVPDEEKQAWEHAYQRMRKRYRFHPGLSQRVFLVWMVRNREEGHEAYLSRRYPNEIGPDSNPYGDPVEALNDPRYQRWQNCRNMLQEQLPAIRKNQLENEMINVLWRRRDRPFQPWNIK